MVPDPIPAIMEAAIDAMVLTDDRGAIRAVNPAAVRMFGWRSGEICGRNLSLLVPGSTSAARDLRMADYLATERTGATAPVRQLQARRRDGTVFPVYLSVGRINGAGPAQFIGYIRDSTDERELRSLQGERSRLSTQQLMHVSRMATMGEMAAGIAHELNQPLAAIANYAYASERFLGMPEPELDQIREAVRAIAAEALRAGDVIRRLRRLVRGTEVERERLRVEELVDELRALTQADARAHDTQMRFEQQGGSVLHVHRVQIIQVLLNFVRNALESLQADPRGGREIRVSCLHLPSADCEIAVEDNGPGVAPEIQGRMFDPFLSTRDHAGLGLPMSLTIAQAHGGTVRHEPVEPRGARFILTLPAVDSAP